MKKILALTLIALFIIINGFLVISKAAYNNDILMQTYGFLQIIFINFVILYILQKIKILSIAFIFIINYLQLLLNACFLILNIRLDFFYVQRNLKQFFYVTERYNDILIAIIFLAAFNTFIIYKIRPKIKLKFSYIIIILLIITGLESQPKKYSTELIFFTKTIKQNDKVINYYQKEYNNILKSSIEKSSNLEIAIDESVPPYLENIIIIHLESLNGFLVNETTTPNLLKIAKEGIMFENYYSNGTQTKAAYENILCSLPNSFIKNLADTGLAKEILCLPKVLNKLDYNSYWFKGGARLYLNKSKDFSSDIGFQEIHNDDIMDSNDTKYEWGYREDTFFKKTFSYLKNNKGTKNFIYIDVGTTNHFPFTTPIDFKNIVPYQKPQNNIETMSNTIFLQDYFLDIAWEKINELFPEKNYTLFILSDHSWPVGVQNKENFNKKTGFEENFRVPLVVILGNDEKYKAKIITNRYSHMDIMPSILDLLNINSSYKFATSFLTELEEDNKTPSKKRKILLVQPYAKRYLNIIDNNIKYQYNSDDQSLISYDLILDPLEENPSILSEKEELSLEKINTLLE